MPRGGVRPGAGRKPGSSRWGEPTRVVRLPDSRVGAVHAWLQAPALGGELEGLVPARPGVPLYRPLFAAKVPAGFPASATDDDESPVDLNQYLIRHEAATFYVRVKGQSMMGAGILDGDILVVDRAREAHHGDIVLAIIDNELTVKELDSQGVAPCLRAHHPDFAPIDLRSEQQFQVWGVVTGVVRRLP